MSHEISQLLQLPIAERLEIVQQLWESIVLGEEAIPVLQWQKDELARRKESYRRNPEAASSWDEALKRLRLQDD
jgi:putative addiction module component (TIGR02574 family)